MGIFLECILDIVIELFEISAGFIIKKIRGKRGKDGSAYK